MARYWPTCKPFGATLIRALQNLHRFQTPKNDGSVLSGQKNPPNRWIFYVKVRPSIKVLAALVRVLVQTIEDAARQQDADCV